LGARRFEQILQSPRGSRGLRPASRASDGQGAAAGFLVVAVGIALASATVGGYCRYRFEAIAWAATDNRALLLTSASDGTVKLWDSAQGRWVDAIPAADSASVAAIAAVALSDERGVSAQ
jgi:hypothetical protein